LTSNVCAVGRVTVSSAGRRQSICTAAFPSKCSYADAVDDNGLAVSPHALLLRPDGTDAGLLPRHACKAPLIDAFRTFTAALAPLRYSLTTKATWLQAPIDGVVFNSSAMIATPSGYCLHLCLRKVHFGFEHGCSTPPTAHTAPPFYPSVCRLLTRQASCRVRPYLTIKKNERSPRSAPSTGKLIRRRGNIV
jgi:hypothetical protein